VRSNGKTPQRLVHGLGPACVIALVLPIACGESACTDAALPCQDIVPLSIGPSDRYVDPPDPLPAE
jgi:hypothetical protein